MRSFIGLMLALLLAGCSPQPPFLASRRDIAWTRSGNTHLVLDNLPLADYPALKKFEGLREVQYRYRTATDAKMKALAGVELPNLYCVTMNGSLYLTDRGIEALAAIPSVHSLGLEGTSITDAGLEIIAARMKPRELNVANCTNITLQGLLMLVRSDTLEDIGFSASGLTTADAVRLLEESRGLGRFQITGPSSQLDRIAIEEAAAKKAVKQGKKLLVVWQRRGSIGLDFPLPPRE